MAGVFHLWLHILNTIEINNYSNSGIFFNSSRMMQPQFENNTFTEFAKIQISSTKVVITILLTRNELEIFLPD